MAYRKKQYYEDNFVMNHFERISQDFVFLDGLDPVAATATITVAGFGSADETLVLTDASGKTVTYTAKATEAAGSNQWDYNAAGGADVVASSIKSCIEHANGHNGSILVSAISSGAMTLTQATVGTDGNTTITENVTNLSTTDFTGGKTRSVPFSYATKGVRIKKNPDAYKTNLG
jgi:hypothetical protein